MRSFAPRKGHPFAIAAALLLITSSNAQGAELFVTGDLGISGGSGAVDAFNNIAPGSGQSSGTGDDSSQVWGVGAGVESGSRSERVKSPSEPPCVVIYVQSVCVLCTVYVRSM